MFFVFFVSKTIFAHDQVAVKKQARNEADLEAYLMRELAVLKHYQHENLLQYVGASNATASEPGGTKLLLPMLNIDVFCLCLFFFFFFSFHFQKIVLIIVHTIQSDTLNSSWRERVDGPTSYYVILSEEMSKP